MPKLKLGADLFRDTFKRMTEMQEYKGPFSNSSRETGLVGFKGLHPVEKPIFNSTQSHKQKPSKEHMRKANSSFNSQLLQGLQAFAPQKQQLVSLTA